MLTNLIFFTDLLTLPKCVRLYGGLYISRIKFLLVTPKNHEVSKKISTQNNLRLHGMCALLVVDEFVLLNSV